MALLGLEEGPPPSSADRSDLYEAKDAPLVPAYRAEDMGHLVAMEANRRRRARELDSSPKQQTVTSKVDYTAGMAIKDPQNPPRFVPNTALVTNRNPASPAYGLAPIMTDGPLVQPKGVFSAQAPTTTPRPRSSASNPKSVTRPPGVVSVGVGPFPT